MSRAPRVVSIRARLLLLLLGATLLCWLVAITWSYVDARRELADLFDAQLAQAGRIVLERAADDLGEDDGAELTEGLGHTREHPIEDGPNNDHRYEQSLHFQIWSSGGRLLYQSTPDLPRDPIVPLRSRGFFDRELDGARWRVLALADSDEGIEVQICQRADLRASLAATVARNMLVPMGVALPALGLLLWLATTAGIRPLDHLATELSKRRVDDVAPLAAEPRPSELAPLAGALDGLLGRLRRRLELERGFTADAAHELRTPLAALKTQAQVALGARTPEERAHALGQVVRGTDRLTHLVRQLLTLARLEPDAAQGFENVDLGPVIDEQLAALAQEATARGVRLHREGTAKIQISGNRSLLATLVANLLENAVRHGRRGGQVRIAVGREGDWVALRVIDDGPGIPEVERERVFDRFHRLPGRGGGSGLGLSIVARIVEAHGGSITLGNGPQGQGLEVAIRFPGAVASPRPVDPGSLPSRGLDPSPRGSDRPGAREDPGRPRLDAPQ